MSVEGAKAGPATVGPATVGPATVQHSSRVFLAVDTRERAVIPFVGDVMRDAVPPYEWVVRQINTGDYLICQPGPGGAVAVRACIERKTYADFAASFKDGRYANTQKMLDLRRRTGCRLYFFVEGPAFPSPDRRFGRIPYRAILSAITSLMVRDGVYVIQTENERHTARRLADLLRAYDSYDGAGTDAAGTDAAGGEPPSTATGGEAVEEGPSSSAVPGSALPAELTVRIEQSEADAVVDMWARLRGISAIMGKTLALRYSFEDFALGRVPPAEVAALRTATGRPLRRDALQSLQGLPRDRRSAVRVLSGVHAVTEATANLILDGTGNRGLQGVLECADRLASLPVPQKTRTVALGQIKADRILSLLRCGGAAAAPAVKPAAVKPAAAPALAMRAPVPPAQVPPASTLRVPAREVPAREVPAREVPEPVPEPVSESKMQELLVSLGF